MVKPVPLLDLRPGILAGMETYDSAIEVDEISRTFDVPHLRCSAYESGDPSCESRPSHKPPDNAALTVFMWTTLNSSWSPLLLVA